MHSLLYTLIVFNIGVIVGWSIAGILMDRRYERKAKTYINKLIRMIKRGELRVEDIDYIE